MPFDIMRTYSQKNIPIINNLIIVNNKKINYFTSFKNIYKSFPIYFMRITPHSIISLTCLDLYTSIYNKLNK